MSPRASSWICQRPAKPAPPASTLVDDQPLAAGRTGHADVHAVVAVFVVGLDDAVAAVFAQLAAGAADAVAAGVLAVVALFADADDGVAADGAALAGRGVEPAQRQPV